MILVTGGSGFIGSVLARRLYERGNRVRVFDLVDFQGRPRSIEFFQGDIRNKSDIQRALQNIDTVYHNAALVPLAKAGKKFWDVNVTGTANLLELCRNYAVKRFVHVSSSAVFGVPQCPITEKSVLKPIEMYGYTKLAGENLVKQYISEGHIATIIRPRTVLGNFRLGIFHMLFECIFENRTVYIIGKGDQLFQFIHVDDLIDVMIKSAELRRSGIFNIGTDRFRTLREDLETFIQTVGSTSKIRSLPTMLTITTLTALDWLRLSPLAPWHYRTYHKPFYFDISKEMKVLGWKPKYSNVEMLVLSYRWYVESRAHLVQEEEHSASIHHSPPKPRLLKLLKWLP